MDEKPKNSSVRLPALPFVGLWSVANLSGWMISVYFWLNHYDVFAPDAPHALLVGLIPALIPAFFHARLLHHGLKKQVMNPWILISLLGGLASAVSYYLYIQTPESAFSTTLRVAALFLPVALAQAAWLSARVKSAWLWAAGGLVTAIVFALPLDYSNTDPMMLYVMIGLAALMQGVITGSLMRHLWTQEHEKLKNSESLQNEVALLSAQSRLRDLSRFDDFPDDLIESDRQSRQRRR